MKGCDAMLTWWHPQLPKMVLRNPGLGFTNASELRIAVAIDSKWSTAFARWPRKTGLVEKEKTLDLPLNHTLARILHVKDRRCVTCIKAFFTLEGYFPADLPFYCSPGFISSYLVVVFLPFNLLPSGYGRRLFLEGWFRCDSAITVKTRWTKYVCTR